MIVATRYGGDVKVRSGQWPDYTMPPGRLTRMSTSGQRVDLDTASGLPAFGSAVRLVAGVIASLRLTVYQGRRGDKMEKPDTWQAMLFEQPAEGWSYFDWVWDIASSLEAYENALLRKVKARGRVVELVPVPMDNARIYRGRDGAKVIEVAETTGGYRAVDTSDYLHIRGQTVGVGMVGVSRVWQHRDPLGAMIAAQVFEGSYFRNHARPDVAIIFPQGVTAQQAEEWRPVWETQYGGSENAGKAIPLGGGADIKPIPMNMRDAQFIESRMLGVQDIGRIMDVDPGLLGALGENDDAKAAAERFLRFQLPPRLARITSAVKADPDLFGAPPLYPLFEVNDLLYTDPLTRAQVQHQQIQNGSLLVDEARADNGRPPLPDGAGQVPQITPVGGAPNPSTEPADDAERATTTTGGVTVPSIELRVEQDMQPIARELGKVADAVTTMEARAADLERRREERALERDGQAAEREKALARALRTVAAPNITVNVDPTPVTVENTVNVPEDAINVNVTLPPVPEREIAFKRDKNGRIVSAEVTETD